MRIGLVIYGSLDSLSGGYLYDRKLVTHLRDQGDHVEIISLLWRAYVPHLLDNFSKSLSKRLQALSIDVLIQDELNHPSLAWLNARLNLSYPVISLVHHLRCNEMRPVWQNSIYRWVEHRYLESVDGFIFNSATTFLAVDNVSKIDKRSWVIATPGGDRFNPEIGSTRIKSRSHSLGPLRLIFLGNIIPRKGLHTLIAALGKIPKGACILTVIGDTSVNPAYTRTILRQVSRLDLKDTVHFHEALEDKALEKLLSDSHVLVVPSSYEGFGIVYLEAMSFGLPVIGTTLGAASEIITPGDSGYLIEPVDSASLADILQKLHKNRDLLTSLSLSALKRFHLFPGWEQSMGRVRKFLKEVITK
jgi:glycosyltransferase involved in cell wall biosynthesis